MFYSLPLQAMTSVLNETTVSAWKRESGVAGEAGKPQKWHLGRQLELKTYKKRTFSGLFHIQIF